MTTLVRRETCCRREVGRVPWAALEVPVVLVVLAGTPALAQEHVDIPKLEWSTIADGRPDGLDGFVGEYDAADGSVVRVGDRLRLEQPGGASNQVAGLGVGAGASGVAVAAVHGTAIHNVYFEHVYNGTLGATVGKLLLVGLSGAPDPAVYMAPASVAGTDVIVQHLKLTGTKKKPMVVVECRFADGKDRANATGIVTIDDYDTAVRTGEVSNPTHLTRDQALQRLREDKELLDLGVLDQEQFEAEKAKYVPFVTGEPATDPAASPEPAAPEVPPGDLPEVKVAVRSRIGEDGRTGMGALSEALDARDAELRACFAAEQHPVYLEVTISKLGQVKEAELKSAEPVTSASTCVIGLVTGLHLGAVTWTTKLDLDVVPDATAPSR